MNNANNNSSSSSGNGVTNRKKKPVRGDHDIGGSAGGSRLSPGVAAMTTAGQSQQQQPNGATSSNNNNTPPPPRANTASPPNNGMNKATGLKSKSPSSLVSVAVEDYNPHSLRSKSNSPRSSPGKTSPSLRISPQSMTPPFTAAGGKASPHIISNTLQQQQVLNKTPAFKHHHSTASSTSPVMNGFQDANNNLMHSNHSAFVANGKNSKSNPSSRASSPTPASHRVMNSGSKFRPPSPPAIDRRHTPPTSPRSSQQNLYTTGGKLKPVLPAHKFPPLPASSSSSLNIDDGKSERLDPTSRDLAFLQGDEDLLFEDEEHDNSKRQHYYQQQQYIRSNRKEGEEELQEEEEEEDDDDNNRPRSKSWDAPGIKARLVDQQQNDSSNQNTPSPTTNYHQKQPPMRYYPPNPQYDPYQQQQQQQLPMHVPMHPVHHHPPGTQPPPPPPHPAHYHPHHHQQQQQQQPYSSISDFEYYLRDTQNVSLQEVERLEQLLSSVKESLQMKQRASQQQQPQQRYSPYGNTNRPGSPYYQQQQQYYPQQQQPFYQYPYYYQQQQQQQQQHYPVQSQPQQVPYHNHKRSASSSTEIEEMSKITANLEIEEKKFNDYYSDDDDDNVNDELRATKRRTSSQDQGAKAPNLKMFNSKSSTPTSNNRSSTNVSSSPGGISFVKDIGKLRANAPIDGGASNANAPWANNFIIKKQPFNVNESTNRTHQIINEVSNRYGKKPMINKQQQQQQQQQMTEFEEKSIGDEGPSKSIELISSPTSAFSRNKD